MSDVIKVCQVFETISKTSGRLDKEKLLKENESEELKLLLKLAFNPYILFGVKDFSPKVTSTQFPVVLSFYGVESLAQSLSSGEIVGDMAKKVLEDKLSCNDPLVVKYLTAVFKKDLKIGVDVKTINKVFPNLIPTFDVGLGAKFDEKYFLSKKNWGVQFKFDGLRSICIVDGDGNASFFSRTGNPQYNFGHIAEEIKSLGLKNVVLDGEALASDWYETASIVHSEKNVEGKVTTNLKYYIFDYLTLEEWKTKKSLPYNCRLERIRTMFITSKYLHKTVTTNISSLEEATQAFEKYFAMGYEGAMLKNMDAPYPFKRSRDWMKLKNTETYDVTIKSYEEGLGRNDGRLGKFICDFNGVEVDVGGGYSDAQRIEFWAKRDEMISKTIEVKCQEVTKDGSLRFPVFMRVREDK